MSEKKSIDPIVSEMLQRAQEKEVSTPFSRAETIKPCPIGKEGSCCKICAQGPCRLVGKTTVGICGATRETVAARNLARMVAAGCAAHSDHGRNMALTMIAVGEGKAPGFKIKDEKKLYKVAGYFGIETAGKSVQEIALEVGKASLAEYGKQEGELIYLKRATPKRQEIWRRLGIAPRGIDREVVEMMHRTNMGTDQDAEHILDHAMRCALADGWGGSMMATDISDSLFGTPVPVASRSNFGVLREDEVNIIVHGHEPTMAEVIVALASTQEMLDYARSKGAKGINLVGMCCSGNELLMRHGIPIVGNYLQQELAIATGAIEAFVVDYQCIMQGIQAAAEHFHTKIITTSPKAKITGAMHIEFHEHNAIELGKLILKTAIDNYPNRKKDVHIPDVVDRLIAGFSHEYIAYMQGGIFRESFRPFNDAVIQGRIRGAAGVVGCCNAQVAHEEAHINIVKELLKNDVLVVTTGCDAQACAKHGLLTPEVMSLCGPGLNEICQTIGVPPVLHMGSCVDNARILTLLTQVATETGLGEDLSDIPVVGLAPEWMSEKAISIGVYFVASGVYTIFGVGSPVGGSPEVTKLISEGWEKKVGGKLEFIPDWKTMVEKSLAHIDAKRKALKLADYDPNKYRKSATYIPAETYPEEVYQKGLRSRAGL